MSKMRLKLIRIFRLKTKTMSKSKMTAKIRTATEACTADFAVTMFWVPQTGSCQLCFLKNLPPKYNSVHLAALFYVEDFKKYGFGEILKPPIDNVNI